MPTRFLLSLTILTMAVAAGCQALPAVPAGGLGAGMAIGAHAVPATLTDPSVQDWTSSRLVSTAFAQAPTASAERRVQAIATTISEPSQAFAGSAAQGKLSSPAFNLRKRQVFWVSDNGWLLRLDVATGVRHAFAVSAIDGPAPTDTFHGTEVTLSKDGQRVYLCSDQGRFFALHSQTGKNLMNSPYAMGGADPQIGFFPAPFVDPLASTVDGRVETVYAVTNMGTLFRFYVDGSAAVSAPFMAKAESYQLPDTSFNLDPTIDAQYGMVDRYRVSPVVFGGKAYLTVYYRAAAVPLQPRHPYDGSALMSFDTLAVAPTLTPTTGRMESLLVGPDSENMQPPVVELGVDMQPIFLFQGDGHSVDVLYLRRGKNYRGYATTLNLQIGDHTEPAGPFPLDISGDEHVVDGLVTTTVAVDPNRRLIFALSGNVLYQSSYAAPTYDATEPDSVQAHRERFQNLYNPRKSFYAKTSLGRSVGHYGPSGYIVPNRSAPLLVGEDIYVLDNWLDPAISTRTTLNHFTTSLTAAPSLAGTIDLTGTASNGAQVGSAALCLDPIAKVLYATTNESAASGSGRWWAIGL